MNGDSVALTMLAIIAMRAAVRLECAATCVGAEWIICYGQLTMRVDDRPPFLIVIAAKRRQQVANHDKRLAMNYERSPQRR